MPSWGRPPGGRPGRKNRRGLGWQQTWDERRFEEIEDSDEEDEDSQGVELNLRGLGKRQASDELYFTGVDLSSSRARRRKPTAFDDDDEEDSDYSEEDDDEGDTDDGQGQHMQVVLREKEDLLVERALERIRRARMLGKTKVKLSQAEIDALDRAERIQKQPVPPKNVKGKKIAATRPKVEERKRSKSDKSSSNAPTSKPVETRRKAKSSAQEQPQQPVYPLAAGPDYGQASGTMVYGQPAYYAPPAQRPRSASSKRASRATSSQSLRQQVQHPPPIPQYPHPYHAGRYFSNPDASYAVRPPSNSSLRSDPSDPYWELRARSASNLIAQPIDQPPYPYYPPQPQLFDPRDPRFALPPGPRIASGPPDLYPVPQIPAYHRPQDELFMYSPSLPPDVNMTGDEDEDEEDYDDDDQGVEIDVVEQPFGTYGIQTRSSTAAAAAGNRGRGGGVSVKRGKRGK